jgi:hypothetical protein
MGALSKLGLAPPALAYQLTQINSATPPDLDCAEVLSFDLKHLFVAYRSLVNLPIFLGRRSPGTA